jgi:hypothetical protein
LGQSSLSPFFTSLLTKKATGGLVTPPVALLIFPQGRSGGAQYDDANNANEPDYRG